MDMPKLTKTNIDLFLTRVYIKGKIFYMDKGQNIYNTKSNPIKFESIKSGWLIIFYFLVRKRQKYANILCASIEILKFI